MIKKKNFFKEYYSDIFLLTKNFEEKKFENIVKKIKRLGKNNKIILVGNGGSSSIASHVATDFTKISKIRSTTFNETNLVTCYANDYGYENWVSRAIKEYGIKGDICILISSSGQSKNMLNAAKECKKRNIFLITLSGFKPTNPLRKLGNINLWVNSNSYNFVEMTHHIWLVSLSDYLAKKKING
jgi:D-sedoheptulose 7-phosphate isomerase